MHSFSGRESFGTPRPGCPPVMSVAHISISLDLFTANKYIVAGVPLYLYAILIAYLAVVDGMPRHCSTHGTDTRGRAATRNTNISFKAGVIGQAVPRHTNISFKAGVIGQAVPRHTNISFKAGVIGQAAARHARAHTHTLVSIISNT